MEIAVLAGLFVVACILYTSDVPPVMAQSNISALPDVSIPQSGQRVLVFSPHPDDETIGVGGYIIQAIKNGADVRIVLVTNGNFHGNEQIRYAEFKKATQILGVPPNNLIFLGFPDRGLKEMDQNTLSSALRAQIEQYNPDIVIYPDIQDENQDHSTIGKSIIGILKANPNKITGYEYLVHFEIIWPRPRGLSPNLGLTPPVQLINSNTIWEEVPLTPADENTKSKAIQTYHSQINNPWLHGLLISSIRRNELLAIPK